MELGPASEGAPGRSHGGIVAAIFDDVLGSLLTFTHTLGSTGELTVRYLAATRIDEPLEFRSRLTGREGRKLFTEAEARVRGGGRGGEVVATARAVFVAIASDRLRAWTSASGTDDLRRPAVHRLRCARGQGQVRTRPYPPAFRRP